jgi:hypothetical protein
MSPHISQFGVFADVNMRPDLDGLVHTTTASVLAGRWATPDDALAHSAPDLADQNARAVRAAARALNAWNFQY